MKKTLTEQKIAILHAFFKNRGGAEKFVFDLRDYYKADLFTGAVRLDIFNPQNLQDSFSKRLFDPKYGLEYLAKDGRVPGVLHIKRMWNWAFNPKIKQLSKYDMVIFSGNIFFVAGRLRKMGKKCPKLITYCHTPPRLFTDQMEAKLNKLPLFLRPFFKVLGKIVMHQYKKDLQLMDLVISNSQNIQNRLQKFVGAESVPIYPPVNTKKFQYISTGDYYLSHSRLEDAKRIKLIVEAFAKMPDKKLVICSTGPLENWIKEQIVSRKLHNITFKGLVSDEELFDLVGNCLTGIVIPVDEDAGIVQCELMSAGKPVIGVNEGGIAETVVDKQTGFLLPSNPTVENLIQVVQSLDKKQIIKMKENCINHAKQFDSEVFFAKMDKVL